MVIPHTPGVNAREDGTDLRLPLIRLWTWRTTIISLAKRDFRARYVGSALGAVWAFLEPAVQFGLYLFVFGYLLGMKVEQGSAVGSFGVYLVSGLIPFLAVQESLVRAVGFARSNVGLVRHVHVPLDVMLAGSVAAVLARYALAFGLVAVYAVVAGTVAPAALLWLPVGIAMLLALTWGLALVLLPAGAYLPDLSQVVVTGSTIVFFLTPVVYLETLLPPWAVAWLPANPLVGLLDTFRAPMVGTPVPPVRLASAAAASLLALLAGVFVYARRARAIRDVV